MAGTPFIISGTITLSDATNPSGARVTIRNDRTIESDNTITDSNGKYIYDLSNITKGYTQGDSVTIIFAYGLEYVESTFTVSGAEKTVDLTSTETLASADAKYATISEVYDELDDKTSSDISAGRIRDYLIRAEAEIDARTGTSFKSNTSTDEVYDLTYENLYYSPNRHLNIGLARSDGGISAGTRIKLLHHPIISITSLSKNGAGATSVDDWTALTEHTGAVAGDFSVYKTTGIIEWLKNTPNMQRRAFKTTYTWGIDRDTTDAEDLRKIELARQLAILITVRQILQSKGSGSQFDGTDSVSLGEIAISKGIGEAGNYIENIKKRIDELFMELGRLTGYNMGLSGGY